MITPTKQARRQPYRGQNSIQARNFYCFITCFRQYTLYAILE